MSGSRRSRSRLPCVYKVSAHMRVLHDGLQMSHVYLSLVGGACDPNVVDDRALYQGF